MYLAFNKRGGKEIKIKIKDVGMRIFFQKPQQVKKIVSKTSLLVNELLMKIRKNFTFKVAFYAVSVHIVYLFLWLALINCFSIKRSSLSLLWKGFVSS